MEFKKKRNGQTHFENLAVFFTTLLKSVCPLCTWLIIAYENSL